MEVWKEYKLGDVCTIVGRIGFRGYTTEDLTNKPEEGAISLSPTNIVLGEIDLSKPTYIKWPKYYESPEIMLASGDIVLVKTGSSIGRTAYIRKITHPMTLNPQFVVLKDITINSIFLSYVIKSPYFQGLLKSITVGSAIPTLSQKNLANLKIQIPSEETQQKIASVISSLDDKIECNRRINDNLEQQAQALFKSWLNECQEEVSIGELSLNITDYSKCNSQQVVLVNSSDVTEGHFEHHNLSENKNLKGHFKKRFQRGDILYSQVRPRNRHWGYCTFNADNYLASTQLMIIRNKTEILPSILLYQYIIDDNVWMDFTLRTETRSGTFPQGNYEDISSIKVPFGANVEVISKELESLYALVYRNEQESRRLAQLRDTLLPRLMSGDLKVN